MSKIREKGSLYLGWILNLINVRYRVKIFEVWKRLLWVDNTRYFIFCRMTVSGTFRPFSNMPFRRLLVRLWVESSQFKKMTGTLRSEHKLSMHLYYLIFK